MAQTKGFTHVDPDKQKILGGFMKAARVRQGLSLMDVAAHMNWTSSQFVWNFENESSTVPIKSIKRLAALYKMKDIEMRQMIADHHIRKIQKKYGLLP